ncbi:G-type lectin S-receptor-like serine/threonine-protein kinase SD1-1 [Vitis vinifera]|uniref:non-specific serine/threonine protein kinase n=1 Tax=Vitis vinifera TaxID=29760 RepID=A0A438CQU2_VITVI|nr:G-type lectin S-receptor-like serine/threonine-protein kinase SD1-1 [Vitis vinifera]
MDALARLVIIFSSVLFIVPISIAVDTITVNQPIRYGETIISAGGSFELGFYTPENSKNQYLGIWYKKVTPRTVVWVANGDFPLTDSLGVLKVTDQGTLVILNGTNSIIWSSNASRSAQNPTAQLLESGNLVLKNGNDDDPENFLWQSFDYPCNTLLPSMKLGRNKSTGQEWNGLILTFCSGPWNGLRFSGFRALAGKSIYKHVFTFNEKEMYYTYELLDSSVVSRLVLNSNGDMQRLTWTDVTGWTEYSTMPMDDCDGYAFCGVHGFCNINQVPKCGCLDGFQPNFPNNWEMGFGQMDVFAVGRWIVGEEKGLKNIKGGKGCLLWFGDLFDIRDMPDDRQEFFVRMSASELETNSSSTGKKQRRVIVCSVSIMGVILLGLSLTWYVLKKKKQKRNGELVHNSEENTNEEEKKDLELPLFDLATILNATNNFSIENKLGEGGFGPVYKIPTTENQKDMKKHFLDLIGVSCISWLCKSMIKVLNKQNRLVCEAWMSQEYILQSIFKFLGLVLSYCGMLKWEMQLFRTLSHSLQGFNGTPGKGARPFTHKGLLQQGQEVAVKRLSKDSRQGLIEFKTEVIHIANLQHRNLVKLLGCCIHGQEKMLIYEYMSNKSLESFIFDKRRSKELDWPKRFLIINGIARGLLYLHQDSRLRIIHRDLKADNILLDSEMGPKISDFGIARSFGGNETEANTTKVVGTLGYISPEYASEGLYSVKSDVFSFGVMVLEIVSGKRNRGFSHPDHRLNLLGHAWTLYTEGRYLELMDAMVGDTFQPSEVLRSIHVGLLCVQHCADDRPSMSSVVLMLSSEVALPQPREPGFFCDWNSSRNCRSYSGTEAITLLSSPDDQPSVSSVVLMLSSEGALSLPKEPGFSLSRKQILPQASWGHFQVLLDTPWKTFHVDVLLSKDRSTGNSIKPFISDQVIRS